MKLLKTFIPLTVLFLHLQTLPGGAEVVARYTFDGRAAKGDVDLRLNSQDDPFPGEDYEPDPQQGESGPRLVNIGGGGRAAYYRSYYNNEGTEGADGREVLELKAPHPHFADFYQTAEGEGPLPAEGSFTWEVIARIDGFTGAGRRGLLIDASKGAGRMVGEDAKKAADKAVTTRLWMRPIGGDETRFLLCFSVPINDQNQVKTISTELEFEKWYHLSAVYDEEFQQARLYVNGQEVALGNVLSAKERSTGFGIAGYGPDVFRIDHPHILNGAFIDAIAFSKGALDPEQWALKKSQP